MLFVKTNSQKGTKFLSGYVDIDGKRVQLIGNQAKKPDKDGKAFYVLFENERNELLPQKVNTAKAQIVQPTAAATEDETAAF